MTTARQNAQRDYTIGSEMVTFSAGAPADIAGTTAERWHVTGPKGRRLVSGMRSKSDAEAFVATSVADSKPVKVALANGSTVTLRAGDVASFVGLDRYGYHVYADGGMQYAVTPCCGATGKGSGDGVVCRSCYREVADYFGGFAEVTVARVTA